MPGPGAGGRVMRTNVISFCAKAAGCLVLAGGWRVGYREAAHENKAFESVSCGILSQILGMLSKFPNSAYQ